MRKLIAMRAILWGGRMYQRGEYLPTNTPVAEVWVENKVAQWVQNPEGEEAMKGVEELEQSKAKTEEVDVSVLDSSKSEREHKRAGRNKSGNLL